MTVAASAFLEALATGERDLPLPVQLSLVVAGATVSAPVGRILRLLPKKRVVFDSVLNGRAVAIKLFVANRSGQRNIARERAGHELARSAGVTCPQLIGECQSECGRFSGLVYEWIASAPSLAQCWPQLDSEQKSFWLGEIVRSALQLHQAGGYQADIHLGNFLLKGERLYALDPGSIVSGRKGQSLPPKICLANLGQLVAQLDVAEQPLLDGAIDWYFSQRHWVDRKAGREKLQEYTRRAWRRRLRDYLRKAKRACTLTCFERNLKFLWACRRSWWGEDSQDFLRDPDAYMAGATLLKDGNTATVVKAQMNGRPVVIKRYNIKNWRHAISRALRPSRAYHSWYYAHLLELAGIPGLRPVALLERRCGPLRGTAYFICEWIDAPDLLAVGKQRALSAAELSALKTLFVQMEKCRLSHGDFKANNLLVDNDRLVLIDLDAMVRHFSVTFFRQDFDRDLDRLRRNWPRGSSARAQIGTLIRETRVGRSDDGGFL